MKVLYFTSMYPTSVAPHGGVFITKRIESIRKHNIEFELYAIVIDESKYIKRFRKMICKNYKFFEAGDVICAPDSDVVYSVIKINIGLLDIVLNKLTGYRHQADKTFRTIVKKLGSLECEIIHGHWLYTAGYAVQKYAEYCKKPCVITAHGSDVNKLLVNNKMRKPILETLKKADCIEFVSKALQTKATKYGYNPINSVIVPNGIDTVPGAILSNKGKFIIGYVGNLIHVKRADKLVKIINYIIKNSEKPLEFYIIGDGVLKNSLEEDLNLENVKFFGRVSHEEVLKKMQDMTVLMLPSRNEGWPCVVLEAHSCGVPVVGSSNGGVPEAINDNRLIVGEDNFEENFANRVLQVINNDIEIDRDALIDRAQSYMWDTLAKRTIVNYKELIEQEEI